jgi:hypothetical protein
MTTENSQAYMFWATAAIMYTMVVYVAYAVSAVLHHVWF